MPCIIHAAILLVNHVVSQELNSTLHSTPSGVQFAFAGEMVVFTCTVRSNSITWSSDEYIGTDQPLTLVSIQGEGFRSNPVGNAETVAVIVRVTDETIVSKLHIRVKSTFPVASVQCVNSGTITNPTTSTSFLLAGMYVVSL